VAEKRPDPQPAQGGSPTPARQLDSLADFAAGLAHEINNPLAIIIEAAGWVEDLLEDELKQSKNFEEMRRSLRQIVTQAGRCRDITHNLLSFAQRIPGRVDDVQLNDLVREVSVALKKKAAARKSVIALSLDDKIPVCRLSPTEMQQVVVNLCNNAMDAMEPAGGRITISTRLAGGEILLDVADTGSGIPPETLRRIFDPFFTTKPVGKGTGLGLSICYGIVSNLGGTLSVDSKVGEGTTFHIRVPITPALGPRKRERDALDDDDALAVSPHGPAVVLIADSEEGLADTVSKRLAHREFVVRGASTGQEAIAFVEADQGLDVVLLDVTMPDMDGTDVLKEIKRRAPLVEVILLSSHTTVEAAIEGMRLGAFDYLVKPCELGQLVAQIKRARNRKRNEEQRSLAARLEEISVWRP
jgi:CheY-like chemotaxis protein